MDQLSIAIPVGKPEEVLKGRNYSGRAKQTHGLAGRGGVVDDDAGIDVEVWRRRLLEYSEVVSTVLNLGQVTPTKYRRPAPNAVVAVSRRWRDVSVWTPILAKACHVASRNMRSRTVVLCGSGRSPSKQGMIHCAVEIQWLPKCSWNPDLPEVCLRSHAQRVASSRRHRHRTGVLLSRQTQELAENW